MDKRRLKIGFASLIGAVTLGLTITAVSSNGGFAFSKTDGGLYSITLNSSNKVTSNGDHLMYTANGGEVTFTYTNTSSSTSGHVSLLDGGTSLIKIESLLLILSVVLIQAQDISLLKRP